MRHATLVLCVILAGCASAGTAGGPSMSPQERVLATGDGAVIRSSTSGAVVTAVAAAPAQVIPLVRQAYVSLDIPVTLNDPASGRVGNPRFAKSGTLAGERMSRFVSCGDGLTGAKADTYRIHFSIETRVTAAPGGGSEIRTAVVATGTDVMGSNADRITCGTTGALEARIADAVKASVAR